MVRSAYESTTSLNCSLKPEGQCRSAEIRHDPSLLLRLSILHSAKIQDCGKSVWGEFKHPRSVACPRPTWAWATSGNQLKTSMSANLRLDCIDLSQ